MGYYNMLFPYAFHLSMAKPRKNHSIFNTIMDQKTKSQKLQSKTRQELADEFGVHPNTFRSMLKRAEIKLSKGLVSPKEQLLIYQKLGKPDSASSF